MLGAGGLPMLLCTQLLSVALSVFSLRRHLGRDWLSAINLRPPALVPCLLAVLYLPAVIFVGAHCAKFVEHTLEITKGSRDLIAQGGLWFTMLVITVGAAVSEELFCRGFLGRDLVRRYGVTVGVLLTSLLFVLLHANLPQGVYVFFLGCLAHLAYLAMRSLWVPIHLHFLNNALAILVSYLVSMHAQTAPEASELPGWVALTITLDLLLTMAIPSAWGLYRLRDREAAVA
jgi:membrane protease YdiL (CAAX protease family)